MNDTLLRAVDVRKDFQSGETVIHVLKGISLDIKLGEIVVIFGPSGAGKSTLLHILGFLTRPTSGEVQFKDILLGECSDRRLAEIRNSYLGFVFQMYHLSLLPELTAFENVLLPAMIKHGVAGFNVSRFSLHRRAREILETVGLSHRIDYRTNKLSGGEQQRVAIARALYMQPEVVLCDEPTGSLDAQTSKEILDIIANLNKRLDTTFVIVTHEQSVARIATRRLTLIDGEVKFDSASKSA